MSTRIPVSAAVGALMLAGIVTPVVAAKLGMFSAHQDIGATPKKGNTKYSGKRDTYAVTGGGANIWAKTDAFQYVYEQVSGDVTLTSSVQWVGTSAEGHRKAGLMIRQSLTPDSPYADVMLHGDGLTALQYRETAGGDTKEMRSDLKAPSVVRIQRHGDQITIAAGDSADDLKTTGPITLHFTDPVYVGLAVCAHNANRQETALFKGVKMTTPQKEALGTARLLARF